MKALFPRDTTLLVIGDSITDAFRKPEELNDAYQMGNGYAFLIASQLQAQNPSSNWSFLNRGVSGNGLRDLENRWESDCLELKPDVLSVLIGINETMGYFYGESMLEIAEFGVLYSRLLRRAKTGNPALKLVLCEPFLLPCRLASEGWREHLQERAAVLHQLAHEFDATFVELQTAFDVACELAPPEYWAYEGVHPTAAGHYLVAQTWLESVRKKEVAKNKY